MTAWAARTTTVGTSSFAVAPWAAVGGFVHSHVRTTKRVARAISLDATTTRPRSRTSSYSGGRGSLPTGDGATAGRCQGLDHLLDRPRRRGRWCLRDLRPATCVLDRKSRRLHACDT